MTKGEGSGKRPRLTWVGNESTRRWYENQIAQEWGKTTASGNAAENNALSSSSSCELEVERLYDFQPEDVTYSLSGSSTPGFVRALEILENPEKFLKPWKSLETLEKPWNFFYEALENLTELY